MGRGVAAKCGSHSMLWEAVACGRAKAEGSDASSTRDRHIIASSLCSTSGERCQRAKAGGRSPVAAHLPGDQGAPSTSWPQRKKVTDTRLLGMRILFGCPTRD